MKLIHPEAYLYQFPGNGFYNYYFRVRSYKKVGNRSLYDSWTTRKVRVR